VTAIHIPVRQRSQAWHDYRRASISATDVGVLLGLSPYKCEADLADEKLLGEQQAETLPMKVGTALEDVIADEYTARTGDRLLRFRSLIRHPSIEWAVASPDRRIVGEHKVVELKWTQSRSRFADGLPDDIQAQVAWQLGVLGWPKADVAALVGGNELLIFEQQADPELFDYLVTVAQDFRRRLVDGGPFARDAARIKRDHPADDGTEMEADTELTDAVLELLRLRAAREDIDTAEERIKAAVQARMADHARMTGPGFTVTWKRTKDATTTNWAGLADGLLRQLPETQRDALVSLHSTTRPGARPFRVALAKGDQE
jgi:putative phage-type endonuclease